MDETFAMEQAHLAETYRTLEELRDGLVEEIEVHQRAAAADLKDLSDEVRPDFVGVDETMETLAAIETLNSVIDAFNQSHDYALDKYRRVLMLLLQPYFAKVRLRMRPGRPPRDIYIGACGVTDSRRNPIVVDWRSPVAETYYNQENGPTHYFVDGRRRDVVLELRRQFDVVRDELRSYFDTTVAIQDSLLLQVLKGHHSEHLKAITATIQREQNEVIRHEDVPVLLVDGIAGSGKTSVMLQRIAYLFYHQRDSLSPEQVHLLTPSPTFRSYIGTVLPSMGESNPDISTWDDLMAGLGLADRDPGADTPLGRLREIERVVADVEIEADDLRGVSVDGTQVLTAAQVKASFDKFSRVPVGPRRAALVREDLHDKVERRLRQLSRDADVQDEMLSLDLDDQVRVFGNPVAPDTEQEAAELALAYVTHRYGSAHDRVDADAWLRVDRVGMRTLGAANLNACEWLYLRLLLAGGGDRQARYVMVDEVQDYTAAQLLVLATYFPAAHFLLLGDERQAIRPGTAGFDELRAVFGEAVGPVETCLLRTSYRSSPEITELFLGLVGGVDGARPTSVRTQGTPVGRVECAGERDYLEALAALCREAAGREGELCALIVDNADRARWLSRRLGDGVVAVRDGDELPASGVVLMELRLAKGLEFDHVVVADAQAEVYPDEPLARRRLYTAVSRAMHEVTLVSEGAMTPLVD